MTFRFSTRTNQIVRTKEKMATFEIENDRYIFIYRTPGMYVEKIQIEITNKQNA